MQDLTKNNFMTLEEAKDGYDRIMKLVKHSIDNSHNFLKEGKYSSSIPTSILALEEIAKAEFLRRSVHNAQQIDIREWIQLTMRGGSSHVNKLLYDVHKREKSLERWSENDIQALNAINKKLGLMTVHSNKESVKTDNEFFKKILPKLKDLKEDCFYSSWDDVNRKWNYFDRRFPDKVKSIMTRYLFLTAKRGYFLLKFKNEMESKKQFKDYTDADWDRLSKSENRLEVIKLEQELSKIFSSSFDLIVASLMQYTRNIKNKSENKPQ